MTRGLACTEPRELHILLTIPTAISSLSLSVPVIARDEKDSGPWRALGKKRIFNRAALIIFFVIIYGEAIAGAATAIW